MNPWGNDGYGGLPMLVPNIEVAVAPLVNLNNRELSRLVENDDAVDEYINQLAQCRDIAIHKSTKVAEAKSLAEYNLSFEDSFEARKSTLKELSSQIGELTEKVKVKTEELRGKSGSITAETALALLQTSASEAEEDSEKIAEKFYQKDVDVEEFLERFQEARERMHLRRVKADKMTELLSKPPPAIRRPAPPPPYPMGPTSLFPMINNN